MSFGEIIAGAARGVADQGIEIANKVILDESKMKELREKARIEKERIDYQYKLDMQKIGVQHANDKELQGTYTQKRTDKEKEAEAAHRRRLEEYDASAAATAKHRKPDTLIEDDTGVAHEIRDGKAVPITTESTVTEERAGVKPNEPSRGIVERSIEKPFKPKDKYATDTANLKEVKFIMQNFKGISAEEAYRIAKEARFNPKKAAIELIAKRRAEVAKDPMINESKEETEQYVIDLMRRFGFNLDVQAPSTPPPGGKPTGGSGDVLGILGG